MRVVESYSAAKTGVAVDNEDGIVLTKDYAAVVDGATDKSGRTYEGMTGGRFLMHLICDAVRTLPAEAHALSAVDRITDAISIRLPPHLAAEQRPAASAVFYSRARREVWGVGDCSWWHEGLPTSAAGKLVDQLNSAMRAAVLTTHLLAGASQDDLSACDPGREAIMPLLMRQGLFANNPDAGEFAYPVFDGRRVPQDLVVVHPVPAEVTTLILASDGYPHLLPTLAQTEANLKKLLLDDPLCIGALRSTKGLKPGADCYDDRSYLRLSI